MINSIMNNWLIECYDVGGTYIRGAFVKDGELLYKYIENSVNGESVSLINQIKNISFILQKRISKNLSKDIKAVAIGLPGPVKEGIMYGSKPLEIEGKTNILYYMSDYFNTPVFAENDLNLAACGEMNIGLGKNINNFCLLSLSTGIGVGVVLNGNIIDRRTEIGHDIIEHDSRLTNRCQGHSGCWVSQASGYGIKETLKKFGYRNSKDFYKRNIPEEIIKRIRGYNAHGIGNLINAYDPEKIIVMGSLGIKLFDKIIPDKDEIKKYTIVRPTPDIETTKLGENVGLLGAYYYAIKKLEKT